VWLIQVVVVVACVERLRQIFGARVIDCNDPGYTDEERDFTLVISASFPPVASSPEVSIMRY
jgi:hypothetical protein